MTRRTSAKLLERRSEDDYEITEADSGAALKKALTQEQPDLVLLDVKLPDGNGLDLLPVDQEALAGNRGHRPDRGAQDDTEAVSWAVEATKRGAFNFIRRSERFDRKSSWPTSPTRWSAASRPRKPACCGAPSKP